MISQIPQIFLNESEVPSILSLAGISFSPLYLKSLYVLMIVFSHIDFEKIRFYCISAIEHIDCVKIPYLKQTLIFYCVSTEINGTLAKYSS